MAYTTTGYQSPANSRVGLVPSVYDKIIQIGTAETPILSKIGTSVVKGIDHSWIIDPIGDPTRTPQLEISGFTGDQKSTKMLRSNAVEISTDEVMVSIDNMAVAEYGVSDKMSYETTKKAKEHKKRFEKMILGIGRDANAKVSVFEAPVVRTEVAAGEAAGLFYYAAKGASSFSAGKRGNVLAFDATGDWAGAATEMTWDKFNQVLQQIYDGGADPKDVFVGSVLKARINDFVTRQLGNEKKANQVISSLETDFGVVNIHLHRNLSAATGLADVMIAGDFSYMKHGLLVPTRIEKVSTEKTAEAKRFYTSSTLEVRNADAFAIGVGLN